MALTAPAKAQTEPLVQEDLPLQLLMQKVTLTDPAKAWSEPQLQSLVVLQGVEGRQLHLALKPLVGVKKCALLWQVTPLAVLGSEAAAAAMQACWMYVLVTGPLHQLCMLQQQAHMLADQWLLD